MEITEVRIKLTKATEWGCRRIVRSHWTVVSSFAI